MNIYQVNWSIGSWNDREEVNKVVAAENEAQAIEKAGFADNYHQTEGMILVELCFENVSFEKE